MKEKEWPQIQENSNIWLTEWLNDINKKTMQRSGWVRSKVGLRKKRNKKMRFIQHLPRSGEGEEVWYEGHIQSGRGKFMLSSEGPFHWLFQWVEENILQELSASLARFLATNQPTQNSAFQALRHWTWKGKRDTSTQPPGKGPTTTQKEQIASDF